jgi:c(7)-type cytochrome triheme protein
MKTRIHFLAATLLLALLSSALLAGTLPNLPKEKALPQGDGSPGVVTFRHDSHVDASRPDCTTCHPTLFPIVKRTAPSAAPAAIRHADMEKGKSCGSCHDGKSAHGLDDCGTCHKAK